MSQHACERYSLATNKWETITIANLPRLAAFSFTAYSEHEIAIVGGSNGGLMQDEMITVDLKSHAAHH